MNFDNDDIMIAKALSDMESSLPMPDLMPGIMEKLSSRKRSHPMRLTAAVVIAAALLITGCAAALGGFEWAAGRAGRRRVYQRRRAGGAERHGRGHRAVRHRSSALRRHGNYVYFPA